MKDVEKLNLIFDLDGTLTDNKPGIVRCLAYAMEKLGRPWDQPVDTDWCVGPPLKDTFTRLLGPGQEGLIPQAIEFYRERFRPTGIYENSIYEGIASALIALRKEANLYVATSKINEFTQIILKHFNIHQNFKGIYGSEPDGTFADKVDLVRHLLETEKLPLKNTVMIGDREHDMKAAVQNGIRGVGAGWGFGSVTELLSTGAEAVLPDPGQLKLYFYGLEPRIKTRKKAYAYITCGRKLLLLKHPDSPEAGIQVPGGSVEGNEAWDSAALREAAEETGLTGLKSRGLLGFQTYDMARWRPEIQKQAFVHLTYGGAAGKAWEHVESQPADGSQPVRFQLEWVDLDGPKLNLIAGQSAFLHKLQGHP